MSRCLFIAQRHKGFDSTRINRTFQPSAESTATAASEHYIHRKELVASQPTILDKWVLSRGWRLWGGPCESMCGGAYVADLHVKNTRASQTYYTRLWPSQRNGYTHIHTLKQQIKGDGGRQQYITELFMQCRRFEKNKTDHLYQQGPQQTARHTCATVESQFVPCCCTSQSTIDGDYLYYYCCFFFFK